MHRWTRDSGRLMSGTTQPEQRELLFRALETRFEANMNRHKRVKWAQVEATLRANPEKLWSINEMEKTGVNRT